MLLTEREKKTYDLSPVYATNYEMSIEAARQHVTDSYQKLFLYAIVCDGNVTRDGVTSDAMVIEACEVGQGVRFHFIRCYNPPGFLHKAKAEENLTLLGFEPERVAAT